MVNIQTMVMAGGWCTWHCYTLIPTWILLTKTASKFPPLGVKFESAQLHRPVPLSLGFAGQSWHVPGGDLPTRRAGCGIYLSPLGVGSWRLGCNFLMFFGEKWWTCMFFSETYLAECHGNGKELEGSRLKSIVGSQMIPTVGHNRAVNIDYR